MNKPFKPGDKVMYVDTVKNGSEVMTVKACDRWEVLYKNESFKVPNSHIGRLAVQYEGQSGFDWAESLRHLTPLEKLL